ncbi:hypothetical protein ACFWD7_58065, partial [Streptomyces mirabilis]
PSAGGHPPRSSKSSYARCNSPVLQRLVELAEYHSRRFRRACGRLGVTQSMGRVGPCFDCEDDRVPFRAVA